jgi:hypothetical protein
MPGSTETVRVAVPVGAAPCQGEVAVVAGLRALIVQVGPPFVVTLEELNLFQPDVENRLAVLEQLAGRHAAVVEGRVVWPI